MAVNTYYFDGSDEAASDPDSVWTNETNADDGSTSTSAYCSTLGSKTTNEIQIDGTNASGFGSVSQVQARVYGDDQYCSNTINATVYTDSMAEELGTARYSLAVVGGKGWSSYETLSAPSGGWTLAKVQALETRIYLSNADGISYVYKVEISVTGTGTAADSERTLYLTGVDTSSSERGIYTWGIDIENASERNLYIQGALDGTSERDAYIWGVDTSSSDRSLYIDGIKDGEALYKNLIMGLDNSAIRNRVYVRGGTYLSDEVTIKQVADGEQTVFYLPEKPHEMSILEGVTSKTVGIKNIDNYTDYDYLMNYQEKYVEIDTAPTVDTVLSFSYKYDIPVLVAVENSASIEKYGQLEYIIFDKTIDTIAQARERASAELTDYAESIVSGGFETEETGFKAGQFIDITDSDLGIDDRFVVKSVTASSQGGGRFVYKIKIVSAEMLGIIHFLINLLESDKNSLNISSDEVVDEITTITAESFSLVADTPVLTTHEGAFKYDSDADWDIAEWDEV